MCMYPTYGPFMRANSLEDDKLDSWSVVGLFVPFEASRWIYGTGEGYPQVAISVYVLRDGQMMDRLDDG